MSIGRRPDASPLTSTTVDVFAIDASEAEWKILVLRRGPATRCPGAWETVHGRIEPGEKPEDAAVRELREETGLDAERLYVIAVQPFYMRPLGVIDFAVVYAAFVRPAPVTLAEEHAEHEWLAPEEARRRFVWPRERQALDEIVMLLAGGSAGPVEDVLRIF